MERWRRACKHWKERRKRGNEGSFFSTLNLWGVARGGGGWRATLVEKVETRSDRRKNAKKRRALDQPLQP